MTGSWPKKNWSLSLVGLTWAGRVTVDLVDGIRFPTAVLLFPNEGFCEPNSALRMLPLASARCPPPFPIKVAFLYLFLKLLGFGFRFVTIYFVVGRF